MAEAVVEDRPSDPMRYFCHMCNVEINIPNTDLKCPLCAGSFVEELPTARPEANSGNNSATVASQDRSQPPRASDWNSLRNDLATLLMSRNGDNFAISFGGDGNQRSLTLNSGANAGSGSANTNNTSGQSNPGSRTSVGGGRVRPQNLDRLDNVLFDFLQTLALGDMDTPFGNSQFVFLGNPGDYAWGREGIDTIVTQLLNQMESSGPPPLTKEKIAEIPVDNVTADEVKKKLQCSVCWEDFEVDESVRRLPCSHIYHESCIIPWLNLHNTCPICRQSLADEETEQSQATESNAGGGVTTVRPGVPTLSGNTITIPLFQRPILQPAAGAGVGGGGTNSNNGGASGNSTSQGNIFGFDNSNMNLDMDLD